MFDVSGYIRALEKRGFVELGSGAFSTVLGKPGAATVIKVGRAGAADGWLAYIAWARQNPSPYAPKVGRIKWHKAPDGGRFYIATVERMDCTVRELQYGKNRNAAHPAHKAQELAYKALELPYSEGELTAHETDAQAPGLVAYMLAVRKQFEGVFSFDMHAGNAMVRADGSFVITDPLSWETTPAVPSGPEQTQEMPNQALALVAEFAPNEPGFDLGNPPRWRQANDLCNCRICQARKARQAAAEEADRKAQEAAEVVRAAEVWPQRLAALYGAGNAVLNMLRNPPFRKAAFAARRAVKVAKPRAWSWGDIEHPTPALGPALNQEEREFFVWAQDFNSLRPNPPQTGNIAATVTF